MSPIAAWQQGVLFADFLGLSNQQLLDFAARVLPALLFAGFVWPAAWYLGSRAYRNRVRLLLRQVDHYRELHAHAATERDTWRAEATKIRGDAEAASAGLKAATEELGLLRPQVPRLREERDEARQRADGLASEVEHLKKVRDELTQKLSAAEAELAGRRADMVRADRRMKHALRLEGQLWSAKALQGRPKFREMVRRRRAIISVLNLKGGVGKTTVTAHLGAALAGRGYRVLLIDLDLQGSLTALLLPQDKISQLFDEERLVQFFFHRAAENKSVKIPDYAQAVFEVPDTGGKMDVVGASDALAYTELSLSMRWLLHSGERDTRFLLRKALHLMGVSDRYDIVLVDCPPIVNISCVNALAASDHVLIPTTFSRKSLERVPQLLGKVLKSDKFKIHVNHALQTPWLVPNRTWSTELTLSERDDWNLLADQCRDVYGYVKQFATVLPQLPGEVRESESEFGPPDPATRLGAAFARLAAEVEAELPLECRRVAKAPY